MTWERLRWPSLFLAVLGAMVAMAVGVRWATDPAGSHTAFAVLALLASLWPVGFGTAVFVGTRKSARRHDEVPAPAALAWLVGFGLGALALGVGSIVAFGLGHDVRGAADVPRPRGAAATPGILPSCASFSRPSWPRSSCRRRPTT